VRFLGCVKDCLVATGLVQKLFVMSVTNIFMVSMGLTDTLCMIKKQLFMVLVGMIKIMVSVGMDDTKNQFEKKTQNDTDLRLSTATCLDKRRRLLGQGRGHWVGGRAPPPHRRRSRG
jgi:hypothetical protein